MAEYQVLFWRDIPSQVRVFDGRKPISAKMPDRFQEEIDRIAMEEGLEGSDDYLDLWSWTKRSEREGTPQEVLAALIQELAQGHDSRAEE